MKAKQMSSNQKTKQSNKQKLRMSQQETQNENCLSGRRKMIPDRNCYNRYLQEKLPLSIITLILTMLRINVIHYKKEIFSFIK